MWPIFPTIGFFSIVQNPNDTLLTVRSRIRSDLDEIRRLLAELSKTTASPHTDYNVAACPDPGQRDLCHDFRRQRVDST
jgi:hypothetical protein